MAATEYIALSFTVYLMRGKWTSLYVENKMSTVTTFNS